jgi:uncharacterized membrane protein YgaE (UPF0421/DUF939 family)
VHGLLRRARARVLGSLKAMVLAGAAAAIAWWIARDAFGHPHPFFAPTAAAISLTTSRLEPAARITQMVIGVLIGIPIGEIAYRLGSSGPVAVGLAAMAAMMFARAIGGGFLGSGVFFANQAAASAILVVALHRTGTVTERAIDALIGGAVAFLIASVALPLSPVAELAEAEKTLIARLRERLDELDQSLGRGTQLGPAWSLETWRELVQAFAGLTIARRAAHANARVAPRWWRRRMLVDAQIGRAAELELLSTSAFGWIQIGVAGLPTGAEATRLREMIERLDRELAAVGSRPLRVA